MCWYFQFFDFIFCRDEVEGVCGVIDFGTLLNGNGSYCKL